MAAQQPAGLADRYTLEDGSVYLSGVKALVRLPMDLRRRDERAGLRTAALVSGYEGSPLAGYDLELARQQALLDEHRIVLQPALNEELAVNLIQGSQLAGHHPTSQYDGVIGLWYGKAPGLDRATDALRHANAGGAHPSGGALVIVGDDSTAKSSSLPSGSELALAALGLPTLSPTDSQDVLDLGIHGVALSRFSGVWVALKIATSVADGSGEVDVDPKRIQPVVPDNRVDGRPYRHTATAEFWQPTLAELERSLFNERLTLAARYAARNGLNRVYGARREARVGIVSAGAPYLAMRQALDRLGLNDSALEEQGIRILRLGMIFPLDAEEIAAFADGLDEIIVVEEKRSFIESAVKDILYGRQHSPTVLGKTTTNGIPFLKADGDLDPETIERALRARFSEIGVTISELDADPHRPPGARKLLPMLSRAPFYCSGCPHNRSTRLPEGTLAGAGIGCHAMVALMPKDRMGDVIGLTQMGGEGATWIGMSPFVSASHLVQNLGDGTFHHSGSLAIRAAVASGANITFKLLHNSAVAMTGGQAAVGAMSVPNIVRELVAEGVARVVVTTEDPKRFRRARLPRGVEVRHRDRLESTQLELAEVPGVTVLIHDQECATELRRKRKRGLVEEPPERVFINERVCEGCGDCGDKSNCLSVQPVSTEYGRKTQIHQASCNKDYSCLAGDCPSFMTLVPAKKRTTGRARPVAEELSAEALPAPELVVPADDFQLRVTGIGGTGVVTVSQIIATAASRSGRVVQTLDQTGLAQKGGAVVSDVKISLGPTAETNRIAAGEADLYLGCDMLVAASEAFLPVASPSRTVSVVSTTHVPTGAMVTDTAVHFPSTDEVVARILAVTRPDVSHAIDAGQMARTLFDDDQFANLMLVGVAIQSGALPLDASAIEEAINLNGVAVDRNIQAFRRGRQFVAAHDEFMGAIDALGTDDVASSDSEEVRAIVASVEAPAGSALADLVGRRVADLIAYQDARYARRYARQVEVARQAEERALPGRNDFALAVAQHLHKLMAYKDEYEVARLSLDPALDRAIEQQFGPGQRASYRLHPPMLRAMGMKRKLTLGPWFRPVFVVLRAMRGLRGTPFDIFGYAHLRRIERQLVREYEDLVAELAAGLRVDTYKVAVDLAELPDMVRGFEQVKIRNIDAYHARMSELRAGLGRQDMLAASEGSR